MILLTTHSITSPALNASPEVILTNIVFGSELIFAVTNLTNALVPESTPVISIWLNLVISIELIPNVGSNLIDKMSSSNALSPPRTTDPSVKTCLPNF